MCNDGCSDVEIGAQPAQMVVVVVRVDDEADRLTGNELDDGFDDCQRARFVKRRFHDRDEFVELDGNAVVRRAA